MKPSYFRRASPFGRGAIQVTELFGPGSREVLALVFSSGADLQPCRASYGRFRTPDGETIDDGLVVPRPDEADAYLLTLHGNPLLQARLASVLAEAGVIECPPAAFPVARAPRIWREALDLLPAARTLDAAAMLLEQGQPSESGLAGWATAIVTGRTRATAENLSAIRARSAATRGLIEPRRVVIAGVPNAGKSTLFNYLLGGERVLTDPAPGTTRDLIEEEAVIGAYPIRLFDGAGLRTAEESIEREGISRMRDAVATADLVLFLEPPNAGIESSAEEARIRVARPVLKVLSRVDERGGSARSSSSPPGTELSISVRTGEGLRALEQALLVRLFGAAEPPRRVPAPFCARHDEVLAAAAAELHAGAPALALGALLDAR